MSKKPAEFRAVARITETEKTRLDAVAEQLGLSTSDVIRLGMKIFLPQFEAGKVDIRRLQREPAKKAA